MTTVRSRRLLPSGKPTRPRRGWHPTVHRPPESPAVGLRSRVFSMSGVAHRLCGRGVQCGVMPVTLGWRRSPSYDYECGLVMPHEGGPAMSSDYGPAMPPEYGPAMPSEHGPVLLSEDGRAMVRTYRAYGPAMPSEYGLGMLTEGVRVMLSQYGLAMHSEAGSAMPSAATEPLVGSREGGGGAGGSLYVVQLFVPLNQGEESQQSGIGTVRDKRVW